MEGRMEGKGMGSTAWLVRHGWHYPVSKLAIARYKRTAARGVLLASDDSAASHDLLLCWIPVTPRVNHAARQIMTFYCTTAPAVGSPNAALTCATRSPSTSLSITAASTIPAMPSARETVRPGRGGGALPSEGAGSPGRSWKKQGGEGGSRDEGHSTSHSFEELGAKDCSYS